MMNEERKQELIKQAKKHAKEGADSFDAWLNSLSREEVAFIIDNAITGIVSTTVIIEIVENTIYNGNTDFSVN